MNGEKESLRKELAWWDCSAIILGIIIGTGIFSVFPQLIANHNISLGLIMLTWILGGIFAWLGGMCFAELSSIFPSAGGDYTYLRNVYSFKGESLVSFLFAWTQVFVIRPSSIAILALIIGNELDKAILMSNWMPWGNVLTIAFSVVFFFTLTNCLALKTSKKLQNTITILKISSLLFIIVAGFLKIQTAQTINSSVLFTVSGKSYWDSLTGLWSALVLSMWVYGGWNEAVYVAEESKNPVRDIPKSLLMAIFTVSVLYICVNYIYVSFLSPEGLAKTSNPASDVMLIWFGAKGSMIMSIIISLSAAGAINGLIFTGGRVSYAIFKDYPSLSNLTHLHPKYRTPRKAIIANFILSGILLLISGGKTEFVESLTYYTAGVFWYFIGLVIISLILARRNLSKEKIPFKVPLYPFFPVLFLCITVGLIWGSVKFKPFETLTGISILTLGIPLYYILNMNRDQFKETHFNASNKG
jgi:amino acid transporter